MPPTAAPPIRVDCPSWDDFLALWASLAEPDAPLPPLAVSIDGEALYTVVRDASGWLSSAPIA